MTREQAVHKREKLAAQLPAAIAVLRGSLLQRTVHHSSGCLKCARGEGHLLWVLNVGYPGGKTRQVSLRPDQVALPARAPLGRAAGSPALGAERGLSRWQDPPSEPAARPSGARAGSAPKLSPIQTEFGGHQRSESIPVASRPPGIQRSGAPVVIAA